ncbi:aminoacylase-1-like isoform X2 [Sipha flava]|uniref:N-acyl-aliphatic-L-amino acid amidohydrolase n=1 Tax=Sipha flava TaxID=143950 RepID=A0A8B8G3U3_9HEMI|nr:aminoacylase-1-like isoform X2 [Sipha flava]
MGLPPLSRFLSRITSHGAPPTSFIVMIIALNKEDIAVTNFRKYLQIPTVHPDVDYSECVNFLQSYAESMGLPSTVHYMAPKKPVVIITLTGQKPELPTLLLTSHMDVVPVYPEKWTYDPFSAYKDEKGNIYGRGAQDMKCVGIQYLETIRRYINEKLTFDRTIHISFMPDEEIGGALGMAHFVKTNEFRILNIGFALDEGLASEDDVIPLFYVERTIWQFYIRSAGTPGHASLLHDNTAAEKLMYVVNKILKWRTLEKNKLSQGVDIGLVTSVNMTILNGGCQLNVVPPELIAGFDVRLAVDADYHALESTITKWCHEAGKGVQLETFKKNEQTTPTKLDDSNFWWLKFKSECDKLGLKLKPSICPAAGDTRYIRLVIIPIVMSAFLHLDFLQCNIHQYFYTTTMNI